MDPYPLVKKGGAWTQILTSAFEEHDVALAARGCVADSKVHSSKPLACARGTWCYG